MISELIQQFNVDLETIIKPDQELITRTQNRNFKLFYVPEALGSVYIPAQEKFVIPYQIRSVLGFGGRLCSGNIFLILMFSKVLIPIHTVELFKYLSAYTRLAVATFDSGPVFKGEKKALHNRDMNWRILQGNAYAVGQGVRDVTQGEDQSRIRTTPLPQIFALARNLALNLYRTRGFTNMAQASAILLQYFRHTQVYF